MSVGEARHERLVPFLDDTWRTTEELAQRAGMDRLLTQGALTALKQIGRVVARPGPRRQPARRPLNEWRLA